MQVRKWRARCPPRRYSLPVLDADAMYTAMESRDRRFEGHFVVGVRTTGIYCRPGCPARIPHRRNVRFYACTAAAQADGLRPCLRCRPDAAPGTPAAIGSPTTVARALRLIAQGALDESGVDALADRLGVTARHLRRLFDRHLGASPLAVARTQRVHFARKLLEETRLPMAEVAASAGFASLRRFNDAVREAFHASPSELRRRGAAPDGEPGALVLQLPFREPMAYEPLLAFLAARAIPGVERVEGGTYARTVSASGRDGTIEVARAPKASALCLRVRVAPGADLFAVVARARALFDLDADPRRIDAHLSRDPRLARGVRAHPGLRVPGAWDGFELAVRAILGQQVSVAAATTLAGRLVARFGRPLQGSRDGLSHLFPTPDALARGDVASIGLPRARAEAIRTLARAVRAGGRPFESIEGMASLTGVGPWTAAYVAMRAGRDPDALPSGDLVLRRAAGTEGARALEAMAEAWRPWRAYAAVHLWSMSAAGSSEARERTRTPKQGAAT
jgi:AraC family transcriptional regulator of adaptative response / DNA-3-methyladenine glycosylase II